MIKEKNQEENNYQLRHLTRDDVRDLLKTNMDVIVGNIEKIMKEKNITQENLATAMRSEQQHVSYILRKRGKGITINVIGRIASALNTSISELAK
jgi:plasmid maintenance system antidote protein VapI